MFSLFSSCRSSKKTKKEKDPVFWLFLDLDGTVFNIPDSVEELESFRKMPHLTEIKLENGASVFMIYREETRAAIKELLAMGVKLAVMTAAGYGQFSTISFLEQALPLDKGALEDVVFINAHIFPGIWHKGLKLQAFRKYGMIASNDFALLLDNTDNQVQSAIDCGFSGIVADGFRQELEANGAVITYDHPDSSYLRKTVEIFKQKISEAAERQAQKHLGFTVEHANIRSSSTNKIVVRPEFT